MTITPSLSVVAVGLNICRLPVDQVERVNVVNPHITPGDHVATALASGNRFNLKFRGETALNSILRKELGVFLFAQRRHVRLRNSLLYKDLRPCLL